MKRTNIIWYSIFALTLTSLFSCRKVFDRAAWEPEASFPIAYANLTLGNLISDTSLFKTDSNGLAVLVFKQKLDSLSLDVLDTFSAPPFFRNFKLDSLRLEVPPFTQSFTLGQAAQTLVANPDPFYQLIGREIISLDGQPLSASPLAFILPNELALPLGDIPINLNQFFQSAELRTGQLEITFTNRFPMNITDINFSIVNTSDNAVLVADSGIQVPVNSSVTKIYDLAGKTVDGNLNIQIPNVTLALNKEAVIHLTDAIEVSVAFKNLQVTSATAIFPEQDVVTDRQAVALEDMGDLELKEAVIEEGNLVLDVISTIQDSIFMTYSMPKTTQNGIPLVFHGVVPPAPPNSSISIQLQVPVKDYTFNLSSPPDYFNRFVYEFRASVKYTGKKVYLNLNDSIVVNVYMNGVRPQYVRGYLGSMDTIIVSSMTTDVFSAIPAQKIAPSEVKLKLLVENGLGINGNVRLNFLNATNNSGSTLAAIDPQLFGQDIQIAAATNPPFRETVTTASSGNSSNFPDLVSLFPTNFDYSAKITVGGLPKDTNSFVFKTSALKPQLEIEVPLNISAEGVILKDTLDINPGGIGIETNGGALRLLVHNGFPLSGTIKATFLSVETNEIVELWGNGRIEAAETDAISGKVLEKKYSKIELPIDAAQLGIVSKSKQVILEAKFDTPPNRKVKIYPDYSAQLTLSGKVAPKVSR